MAPLAGGSGGGFTRQNLPAKIGVTTTVPRVYRREARRWYAGGDGGARPRSERRGAQAGDEAGAGSGEAPGASGPTASAAPRDRLRPLAAVHAESAGSGAAA